MMSDLAQTTISNNKRHHSNNRVNNKKHAITENAERDNFYTHPVEPVEPCQQPDTQEYQEYQATLKKNIQESRLRIQEIDTQLTQIQLKRNAALEVLKPSAVLLRNVKAKKQDIYAKLEANKTKQDKVHEGINSEKEAIRQLKKNLQYKTEQDIDHIVEELERNVAQSGLSLREEKAIIGRIRAIKAKKADIKAVQQKEQAFASRPDELAPLKSEKEQLYQQLQLCKSQEKSLHSQVDGLRSDLDSLNQQMQDLKEERTSLYESRKTLKAEVAQQKQAFESQLEHYQQYQKWMRYKRWLANKKIRDQQEAYRRQKEAEKEAELAKLDPYQEQKDMCAALASYLQRFIVEQESLDREEGEAFVPTPDIDDDDWGFSGFVRSQKEGKGKRYKRQQRKSTDTIIMTHSPDVFGDFHKLGVPVPMSVDEVPDVLRKVEDLRNFYDNAPHPRKMKEAEELKKQAEESLRFRRKRTKVTRPLFEAERVRLMEEQGVQDESETASLLKARADAISLVISLAEAERQSRIQEERKCVSIGEFLRRLHQRQAVEAMKREQMERIASLRHCLVLEELSRVMNVRAAVCLREDSRRAAMRDYCMDVDRGCSSEVIGLAERERARRVEEALSALEEEGEPSLVVFMRENAPVYNSHL